MPRTFKITGATLVTAPTSLPVTFAECRTRSRLVDVSADQVLIDQLIAEATSAVQTALGQQLLPATYRVKMSDFPLEGEPIRLPLPPLSSITSIVYIDTAGVSQTLATSVYAVNVDPWPGEVSLAWDNIWPLVQQLDWPVTVTFVAGRAAASDVPDSIKGAIRALVGCWLDNPRGYADAGETKPIPFGIAQLLAAERHADFDAANPMD